MLSPYQTRRLMTVFWFWIVWRACLAMDIKLIGRPFVRPIPLRKFSIMVCFLGEWAGIARWAVILSSFALAFA